MIERLQLSASILRLRTVRPMPLGLEIHRNALPRGWMDWIPGTKFLVPTLNRFYEDFAKREC